MINKKKMFQFWSLAVLLACLSEAFASRTVVKTYYTQFPDGLIRRQIVKTTELSGASHQFQVTTTTEGLNDFTYTFSLIDEEQGLYELSTEGSEGYIVTGLQSYLQNHGSITPHHQLIWYESSPPAILTDNQFAIPIFNLMYAFPTYSANLGFKEAPPLNRMTLQGRHINDYSHHNQYTISTSELVLTDDLQLASVKDLGYQAYNPSALKKLKQSGHPAQRCFQQVQKNGRWQRPDRGDPDAAMMVSACLNISESEQIYKQVISAPQNRGSSGYMQLMTY